MYNESSDFQHTADLAIAAAERMAYFRVSTNNLEYLLQIVVLPSAGGSKTATLSY
jgi:hypothetical protein